MKKYSFFDIANYFLCKAKKTGTPVTNLKLQKLVYYAQAWHLAMHDEPLMKGAEFQAWIHGPVIRDLWDKYKTYGYKPIDEQVTCPELDTRTAQFLEEVIQAYFDKDAYIMELMTHEEAPWVQARKGYAIDERCSNTISEEAMKSFFRSRLGNSQNN